MGYYFPKQFRFSTLDERREFYENEFMYDEAKNWLNKFGANGMSLSLDLGVETGIIKVSLKNRSNFIRIGVVPFDKLKETLLYYLPEDIYYDRYLYKDVKRCHQCDKRKDGKCFSCNLCIGQELLFDIDPENYYCPNCDAHKSKRVFSFCKFCLKAAKEGVQILYDYLSKRFSQLQIVFSGRGYHVHVLDESAWYLSQEERYKLAREAKLLGVGVDLHVSTGNIYLVRMPYSLHGLVSRITLPIDIENIHRFDPILTGAIPNFLKLKVNF